MKSYDKAIGSAFAELQNELYPEITKAKTYAGPNDGLKNGRVTSDNYFSKISRKLGYAFSTLGLITSAYSCGGSPSEATYTIPIKIDASTVAGIITSGASNQGIRAAPSKSSPVEDAFDVYLWSANTPANKLVPENAVAKGVAKKSADDSYNANLEVPLKKAIEIAAANNGKAKWKTAADWKGDGQDTAYDVQPEVIETIVDTENKNKSQKSDVSPTVKAETIIAPKTGKSSGPSFATLIPSDGKSSYLPGEKALYTTEMCNGNEETKTYTIEISGKNGKLKEAKMTLEPNTCTSFLYAVDVLPEWQSQAYNEQGKLFLITTLTDGTTAYSLKELPIVQLPTGTTIDSNITSGTGATSGGTTSGSGTNTGGSNNSGTSGGTTTTTGPTTDTTIGSGTSSSGTTSGGTTTTGTTSGGTSSGTTTKTCSPCPSSSTSSCSNGQQTVTNYSLNPADCSCTPTTTMQSCTLDCPLPAPSPSEYGICTNSNPLATSGYKSRTNWPCNNLTGEYTSFSESQGCQIEKVAFTRDGQGYVMNNDGTQIAQILGLNQFSSVELGGISSDYFYFRGSTPGDIHRIKLDGTGLTNLTPNSSSNDDRQPTMSCDGTKLAFQRDGEAYVSNSDGSNLSAISGLNQFSSVSIGGLVDSELIFRSPAPGDIYKIKLDGTGLTNLTPNSSSNDDRNPVVDCVSKQVAFTRDGKAYLMNNDGSNLSQILGLGQFSSVSSGQLRDGYFFFKASSPGDIYKIKLDGTGLTNLTPNSSSNDDRFRDD